MTPYDPPKGFFLADARRAKRRARDLAMSLPLMDLGSTQAIQAVASAIREAVEEEREAIAAMVEIYAALIPDLGALPVNGREAAIQAANEIAAAIRARGEGGAR